MSFLKPDIVRIVSLSNGFKLKEQPDGTEDLNPYVYDCADAIVTE
jgi:hypothetical protein